MVNDAGPSSKQPELSKRTRAVVESVSSDPIQDFTSSPGRGGAKGNMSVPEETPIKDADDPQFEEQRLRLATSHSDDEDMPEPAEIIREVEEKKKRQIVRYRHHRRDYELHGKKGRRKAYLKELPF